jgi:Fungal specific transcription factor domain
MTLIQVKANFNVDKNQLIARYRFGTEKALEQADFLNNPDMTLLQALTIYLSFLQYLGEEKTAWFLAGVLVRIAVSMKFHIDGAKFASVTPFEVQMRRRIWWQICLVDSRAGNLQASSYKLSEDMFDTEMPTNSNDANLESSMPHLPLAADAWTDVSAFLLRCEIWQLSRRLQSVADFNQKCELFKRIEARIEETYLKHPDLNQPFQSFIATSMRLFLSQVNLILSPKLSYDNAALSTEITPSHLRFTSSLDIIEYTHALHTEPSWSPWRWQIRGRQPPWNALRFVLGHLNTREWEPIHERALTSIQRSLDSISESAKSDSRYEALLVLLSAVQKRTDNHRCKGLLANVPGRLFSSTELSLPTSFARTTLNEDNSNEPSQELFLDAANYSGADMDWHAWDEIAGDLEIWDVGSL